MKAYDRSYALAPEERPTIRTLIDERELQLLRGRQRVLDLGCGDGLTTTLLAAKGFTVTGIDYSAVGLSKARERLEAKGLTAELTEGDIYEPLPFADNSFDAVVSYQVINHNRIDKIRELLRELDRVLAPRGLLSVKVADARTYTFVYYDGVFLDEFGSVFTLIAPRTFLPIAGHEKGVIHYDFNEELLLAELESAGFTLRDRRHEGCHLIVNCERRA